MANSKTLGARKEAILQVRDEEGTVVEVYKALFTTRALADAEARIGKSMSQVLSGFTTGRSGVREIALLLQAGMEAHRRSTGAGKESISFDDACDALDLVGLTQAAEAINKAIVAVFNYGTPDLSSDESEEKADPEAGEDDPNA